MLDAGDRIDKYEIIDTIAAGGMGVVFRARHALLGNEVALKVLLPNLAMNERVRTRFRQEGYVQAELRHPNIARVLDFVDEGKSLAIVLELIDGPSLDKRLLERDGPWPLDAVRAVMEPVLQVMAHAHERGVVHRDIKPANILLGPGPGPGRPVITDFGLARILATESGLTRTGAVMGTFPYMSPEQYAGEKHTDARADVFALGMLMYRLLSGELPADPQANLSLAKLYTGATPIPNLAQHPTANVPAPLADVVAAALALDPTQRPADAQQLLRGFTDSLRPRRTHAPADPAPAVDRAPEPAPTQPETRPAEAMPPEPDVTDAELESDNQPYLRWSWLISAGLVMALVVVVFEQGRDLPGSDANEPAVAEVPTRWVRVHAGSFMMGSPPEEAEQNYDEQEHPVTLTRDFLLQATEVTQKQWQDLMGTSPGFFTSCGPRCPVEGVNWWDAAAYCNALSRQKGQAECYTLAGCSGRPGDGGFACKSAAFAGLDCPGYRLPTEAEWEYAARAGTSTARYGPLDDITWYRGNSNDKTHPVATLTPNAWGLSDMLGNVEEWCHDWHDEYPRGSATNPVGGRTGSMRVLRGGAYITEEPEDLRAASRSSIWPQIRASYTGFRTAKTWRP